MLADWRASGREVAIVGLGKSGVAAALLLRERGVSVYASDVGSGPGHAEWETRLRLAGAAVQLGGHDVGRIAHATAVIVAPGVPPDAPPLEAARRAGVPIYAEADLGVSQLAGTKYVAITGTNGKTTTTSLIAQLMSASGLRAETAGNIGRPVCDVARAMDPPDWLALELSSFQLHDMPHVRPAVGVVTNLAPNHLDRYHTLEEYYADKELLFRNAGTKSVWVTNGDDAAVQHMTRSVPGRQLRFSLHGPADGWVDRERGTLMLGDAELLARSELRLLGEHNVANALAAALAAGAIGCRPESMAEGLREFRAIPHRVEPIREVNGVIWVNDSKSTNVTSTEVAIAAIDRPFVLLLGGRHKGEPYTRLGPLLEGRCRTVIAYGESREIIAADLGGAVRVIRAGSFDDVLKRARSEAHPGEAVLLSPACSSYDMFRNYEERGEAFRAAVEAL